MEGDEWVDDGCGFMSDHLSHSKRFNACVLCRVWVTYVETE